MGSGRADYALASIKDGNVYINRWENKDYGGTMVRGDGARYCDMTGSGSDDYVFIDATGAITLFENNHNWGYWAPRGVIYDAKRARQEIHLADFDGDGKCDILLVDRGSGATTVIQNRYSSGEFSFTNLGVATGSASCAEGYGSEKHDLGVQWKDLDGDSRADFLCIQTNGVITGYLNKGVDDMVEVGLIKHAEGKERKNLRLHDINGDGRDDLLYVNMINGAVTAWYSGGGIPSSGSAFQWNWQGNVSIGGSSRGSCVEFGALYGQGRADYIVLEPSTNKAWTWFNVCPDGIGPVAPNLPTGAPPAPAAGSQLPGGVSVIRSTTIISSKTTVLINTIAPTTTTDSQGITFVGTLTTGLSITTQPPITGLETFSTFPPSITWLPTTVSSNTHDPQGHPVLAPWPPCWFCPPGGHGIILSGIGPGVYPRGGPPKGLPTPFPRLTILPDGTPQYSSEDDSCDTVTVTDFWVSCKADQTSCKTTSSRTASGCGATPTAFTTAPACSLVFDSDDDQGNNGSPTSRRTTAKSTATRAPTKTTPVSYPTQTAPWDPKIKNYAYCYSANSDGDLRSFSDQDYTRVTEAFCRNNFVLDPGHGPISWNGGGNGYDVILSADWAKDQTGCSAQKPYEFAKNLAAYERCRDSWLGDFYCNGEATFAGASSFGGAYVFDDSKGCIVFDIHTRPKLGTSGQNKRGLGYGLMSNVSSPAVMFNSSALADVWPEFDGVSSAITGRWTLTNVFAMDPNK